MPPVFEVRAIRTGDELCNIAELDKKTYGEHSVDYNGLLEWWQCYQQGIYALLRNSIIIGAVGIWPLTKNAFEKLIAGSWRESKIGTNDICEKSDKQMYWYFGDIILEKKYTGKKYDGQKIVHFLLNNAAKVWIEEAPLADTVDLCAIGATDKDVHILEHWLGFMYVHRKTPDGLPIYRRTALVTELVRDFEKLQKIGDRSQSTTPTKQ